MRKLSEKEIEVGLLKLKEMIMDESVTNFEINDKDVSKVMQAMFGQAAVMCAVPTNGTRKLPDVVEACFQIVNRELADGLRLMGSLSSIFISEEAYPICRADHKISEAELMTIAVFTSKMQNLIHQFHQAVIASHQNSCEVCKVGGTKVGEVLSIRNLQPKGDVN